MIASYLESMLRIEEGHCMRLRWSFGAPHGVTAWITSKFEAQKRVHTRRSFVDEVELLRIVFVRSTSVRGVGRQRSSAASPSVMRGISTECLASRAFLLTAASNSATAEQCPVLTPYSSQLATSMTSPS